MSAKQPNQSGPEEKIGNKEDDIEEIDISFEPMLLELHEKMSICHQRIQDLRLALTMEQSKLTQYEFELVKLNNLQLAAVQKNAKKPARKRRKLQSGCFI